MANSLPLGVIQPTPGTPLDLFGNFPDLRLKPFSCNNIYIQVLTGNLTDVYIGKTNLNKGTRVGLISVLRPPTANHLPDYVLWIPNASNAIFPAEYRVDVDNANDGIIATLFFQ